MCACLCLVYSEIHSKILLFQISSRSIYSIIVKLANLNRILPSFYIYC